MANTSAGAHEERRIKRLSAPNSERHSNKLALCCTSTKCPVESFVRHARTIFTFHLNFVCVKLFVYSFSSNWQEMLSAPEVPFRLNAFEWTTRFASFPRSSHSDSAEKTNTESLKYGDDSTCKKKKKYAHPN